MAIFGTKANTTAAANQPSPSLAELEAVIAAGLETISKIGAALCVIRNEKLYQDRYTTFVSYLAERWKMTADYANKLIDAASICAELTKLGLAEPTREAHTRELRKVPADKRPEVWTESLAAAGNDPANVTAELVASKAAPHRKRKVRRKTPKTIVLKGKGWTVSISRKTADVNPLDILDQAAIQLQGERKAAA